MDADKTKIQRWMLSEARELARCSVETSLEQHACDIALALASAYRRGMADALELKLGEEKAHLITVHQPDGQIVTVKSPETKEDQWEMN